MATWPVRTRAVLETYFPPIVLALVLVGLVGGWMAYSTHFADRTVTEQRPGSSWETNGQFDHAATVAANSSVYDPGTRLAGREVYVPAMTPVLDGNYTFAYDASDGGRLDASVTLTYSVRSVSERGDNSTVVWETTERRFENSRDSLAPGQTIRVPFSVDVNESMSRAKRIETSLRNPLGQTEGRLVARVHYEGTVNGEPVDAVESHAMPIDFERGTFQPGHEGPFTDEHRSTRTVTVERTVGPIRAVGGPALLLVGLFGLSGLAAARWENRIELTDTERELLAFESDRDDYAEWISTIELPEEALDRPAGRADSLRSLVDFAIDTDNRVIECPEEGVFHVLHDGYRYTYRPPTLHETDRADTASPTGDDPVLTEEDPFADSEQPTRSRLSPPDDPFEE